MFQSARLKLTAWYLLIIMAISIFFSIAFYYSATREIRRIIRVEQIRQDLQNDAIFPVPPPGNRHFPTLADLLESERNLQITLGIINLGILLFAGGAGYFLAGRTLMPIQMMVSEQNRFITDASHELRTPLTALRSEMEAGLLSSLSEKEAKELIKSNLEEVIHLQTLSDGLLQLAHFQKPQKQDVFTSLSAAVVISDVAKKMKSLARKKQISFIEQVTEFYFQGNKQNIHELLTILLDNAIKYSPKQTTITIATRIHEGVGSISIADQGVGISEEEIPFIFDRFYRADKSRSKLSVSGYGLGLSIARKIVDEHHGSLSVKSTLKKGTTFTISFPLKKYSS